jgi:tetratricopeptide (TPR) repeat protein
MRRAALVLGLMGLGILSSAVWAGAQATSQPATQNPPATGQTAPAQGATGAAPVVAPPTGKRPPQAKTQPEYDAYNAAKAVPDAAAMEKAADDFATKYPDSEIRVLLYQNAMRSYQNANNPEKTDAMGRKVLSFDPDNPEALITVAEVITERTHDSDIDKDQRYGEAIGMAQRATQTVDTDLGLQPGTPQEKIDGAKGFLRSQAYMVIGTIDFKKESFADAVVNLQKSIDAYPSDPDKVVVLRLALALDREATGSADQTKKDSLYAEALKVANHAVDLTKTEETGVVGTAARRERDRLQSLVVATPGAQPQTPPKN